MCMRNEGYLSHRSATVEHTAECITAVYVAAQLQTEQKVHAKPTSESTYHGHVSTRTAPGLTQDYEP